MLTFLRRRPPGEGATLKIVLLFVLPTPHPALPASGEGNYGAMALPRIRAIERWWLRAGVFLLPLAYTWDTYDRFVLPKLLLARLLVIGLLILFLVRSVLSGALMIRRTPLDLPILVFVVSALVSTVFAVNQNVAIFGTYTRYDGLLTIVTYAGLFWLSVQALADRDEARTLLRILLASGYLVAAIAIIQSVTDSVAQQSFVPAFGTLGQKNVLGIFLAMLAPLAFWEVVEAAAWSRRVIALNAFAVIVIALVLSQSRSAWLGATIAGVVLLFGRYRPSLRVVIAGISVTLIVGGAIAAFNVGVYARAIRALEVSGCFPTPARRDRLRPVATGKGPPRPRPTGRRPRPFRKEPLTASSNSTSRPERAPSGSRNRTCRAH